MSNAIQGRYRPALRAAWALQAATIGADPKDKVAADAWYRGQLAEVVGLTTTAGASDETMEILCKYRVGGGCERFEFPGANAGGQHER